MSMGFIIVGCVVGKIFDLCVFTPLPVIYGVTWMMTSSSHTGVLALEAFEKRALALRLGELPLAHPSRLYATRELDARLRTPYSARPSIFQKNLSSTPVSTNQIAPFRFRFALERSQPHVH